MMRAPLILLAACIAILNVAEGRASGTDRAADMLAKAEAALAAARAPKERLAALGRAAQAQEAALRAVRSDLRAISAQTDEAEAAQSAEATRLAAVASALHRLERAPRAALALHPDGALAAARAGMTLAAFAPKLKDEATRLADRLSHLRALTAEREAASDRLRASLAGLRAARAEMAELIRRDREAASTPAALIERIGAENAALAESAAGLRALADALPAGPGGDGRGPLRFSAAKGALIPPVEGELTGRFGVDGREGVVIEAPAYAEIYAPWRGVVRFADRFGEEGVVVILEPEADHLVVFSGLGVARRRAGEVVAAGEPLGLLAGPGAPDEEFLISSASAVEAAGREALYMELRQGGAPVDPAEWFAFETEKR